MKKTEQTKDGGLKVTIRVRPEEPIYLPVGTYQLIQDIKVRHEQFLIEGCRVEGARWGIGKGEGGG